MGSVAFFEPLTATAPRSFRPPSIQTSSMPIASLESDVSARAAGATPATFAGCFFVLVFAFIEYPAVARSRFEDTPRGRARRAPPRGAAQAAPCMDRPDRPRSPAQEGHPV